MNIFALTLRRALPEAPATDMNAIANDLAGRYAEAHRHWHTASHIEGMLRRLDVAGIDASPALLLAILFHDAIYDPRAFDNEARSAALADEHLSRLNCDRALIDAVMRLVLATAHHEGDADIDTGLLLDLDLAILADAPDAYDRYADAVRREYAHLDDAFWARGRGEFLKAMLNRSRLFSTLPDAGAMDRAARGNFVRELDRLRAVVGGAA